MRRSGERTGTIAAALAEVEARWMNPENTNGYHRSPFPREEDRTFHYAPFASGLDIVKKTLSRQESASFSPPEDRVPWSRAVGMGHRAIPERAKLVSLPRRAVRRFDHGSKARCIPSQCNGRAGRPLVDLFAQSGVATPETVSALKERPPGAS